MAIPEVQTLLGRAAARRHVLEGLIAAAPEEYWARRAAGDAWTALDHLRHVATIDRVIVELGEAAAGSAGALWVGGTDDAEALQARREALMERVGEQGVADLVATMREAREAAVGALAALPSEALGREVRVAGVVTSWGAPQTFALRSYLAVWAGHDEEHEHAIRAALETPPDASTLTLAARQARDGRRS